MGATAITPGWAIGGPTSASFPNGLTPLIAQVEALGMEFGLWIEPEMVNPNSDLYRAHPDWVIHFPTRPRSEVRNQLILNFARADVQDYIIDQIDRLLSENKITFIKWDMNRNVSEPGWPDAPGDQRELWVRYVQGLYRVWGTLAGAPPTCVWQSCSGGGGRADLGILRLADQIWVSDKTEAAARLAIQEGFSQIFPANTMEAWVTDVGAASPARWPFASMSACAGRWVLAGTWRIGASSSAARRPIGSRCTKKFARSSSSAISTGCARRRSTHFRPSNT